MGNNIVIKEYIRNALQDCKLAVLATEGDGQPHASLIAISPVGGFRQLIFATYRNTRKYTNLIHNGKVAVLIESGDISSTCLKENFVLTAYGFAEEISIAGNDTVLSAHLEKHPDLDLFVQSADCAVIRITVNAYQVVRGIDDVQWWTIDDLDAPANL
jgi:heme iron utilization protein